MPETTASRDRKAMGFGAAAHRVAYIDCLRAMAITGVIGCHAAMIFPNLSWRAASLAAAGAFGVHLFFVASALTLLLSWSSHQNGAAPFYVRRLFRIAPMFWLAVMIYVPLDAVLRAPFWIDGTVDTRNVLLTLCFCHGWLPDAINAVVPGGWTIAVEMTFYAVFPILATYVSTLARACLFAVAAVLIGAAANDIVPQFWSARGDELAHFTYYWLPNSLPSFAIGFVAFRLLDRAPSSRFLSLVLLLCAALIGLYVAWGPLPFASSFSHPLSRGTVFSAACLLLVLALHRVPHAFLVNRLTGSLGHVSYSAYLVHWLLLEAVLLTLGRVDAGPSLSVILWLCFAVLLVAATGTLASVTYRYIEVPCIRMGSRLARRLRPTAVPLLVS